MKNCWSTVDVNPAIELWSLPVCLRALQAQRTECESTSWARRKSTSSDVRRKAEAYSIARRASGFSTPHWMSCSASKLGDSS